MAQTYGQLIKEARCYHDPPISSKELATLLGVSPPFITDIEKSRRLPSLDKQKQIKQLLACNQYPEELFDDLAANDNPDIRIVAEDIAQSLRTTPALREMLRTIRLKHLRSEFFSVSPSVEPFNEAKYRALMDGLECSEILSNPI